MAKSNTANRPTPKYHNHEFWTDFRMRLFQLQVKNAKAGEGSPVESISDSEWKELMHASRLPTFKQFLEIAFRTGANAEWLAFGESSRERAIPKDLFQTATIHTLHPELKLIPGKIRPRLIHAKGKGTKTIDPEIKFLSQATEEDRRTAKRRIKMVSDMIRKHGRKSILSFHDQRPGNTSLLWLGQCTLVGGGLYDIENLAEQACRKHGVDGALIDTLRLVESATAYYVGIIAGLHVGGRSDLILGL